MAVKVILLVAVAAVVRAGHQVLTVPGYSAYNHANPVAESQPLLDAAFRAHATFINFLGGVIPKRYNWGYQITDPVTGDIKSQYESKYGDLAHGSSTLLKTDRTGTTLYYSVDDLNRSISAERMERTIVRLHVRVVPPKNKVNRDAELISAHPLAVIAARAHTFFLNYYRDAVPTRYSWEYDVQDPVTGDNMSQYQSQYDDVPRGSYTLAKPDGSSRTIYYSIDGENNIVVERAEVSDAVFGSPTFYTPNSPTGTIVYTSHVY